MVVFCDMFAKVWGVEESGPVLATPESRMVALHQAKKKPVHMFIFVAILCVGVTM